MQLLPIDSAHMIWPHFEAALQRVKEKTGERWAPAFVLKRIVDGQAGLFRFQRDGKHIAYAVFERYDQGDGAWLNVWVLEGQGLEFRDECILLIDELTRSVGADSWRCTGREGWGRALGEYLKPVSVVYERKLT